MDVEKLIKTFEKMKKIDPKCPQNFGSFINYLMDNFTPKKTFKEKLKDLKEAFIPTVDL